MTAAAKTNTIDNAGVEIGPTAPSVILDVRPTLAYPIESGDVSGLFSNQRRDSILNGSRFFENCGSLVKGVLAAITITSMLLI